MGYRSRQLYQPFLFLIIGGITFLIDVIVTVVCHDAIGLSSSVSAGIGFVSGFAFSFPMNRKTVFASARSRRFTARIQAVLYLSLCLINLFLTGVIVGFLSDRVGLPIAASKVVSTGLIAVENFFVFKYVIFSVRKRAPAVLAFDLDGTLAPSKSPVTPAMAALLARLLESYDICVISGGAFGQFTSQLIDVLDVSDQALARLHIMPTCGTRYYRYKDGRWQMVYARDFSRGDRNAIITALEQGSETLGLREPVVYGDVIEDRGSQITFSALGQDVVARLGDEGVRLKEAWDPDGSRKARLRDEVAARLPGFEVRVGGTTSIDVTEKGVDKAYGIRQLITALSITADDIVFFGDQLGEGGNDFPVRSTGVRVVAVTGWENTLSVLAPYANETT